MPSGLISNGDNMLKSDKSARADHPTPSLLAHVVLRTTPENYENMIAFYMHVLNARIAHASPIITFLRYDDEHHRIAILQTPDVAPKPQDTNHAGMDHIAFTYSSLTELARTYEALKNPAAARDAEGRAVPQLRPIWCVNHGPTTSLYYRDPDSNKIELQVDNFDTTEGADTFMSGNHFAENPIGTDFDPEEWSHRILAKSDAHGNEGLTADEVRSIKARVEIGERPMPPVGF